MRYKEFDMNKMTDVKDFGTVTIVKRIMVDTSAKVSNRDAAKKFANDYADENGLKVVAYGIDLNSWYEKKVGMWFDFIRA